MTRSNAYNSFVYHGDRIFSPIGKRNIRHEILRHMWARVLDDGSYKQLPNTPIEADSELWNQYQDEMTDADQELGGYFS